MFHSAQGYENSMLGGVEIMAQLHVELAPLSEPVPISDIFVSGMTEVEELAPSLYRFTFYATHKSLFDGSEERIIVARLIGSGEVARSAATAALSAVGGVALRQCLACIRISSH